VQPEESSAEPPVQLPWWADNPPEAARPLLFFIERQRTHQWAQADALRDMAAASTVRAILQRQATAMEDMLVHIDRSRPTVLLPDFSRDDYTALETAILALIPRPEQLADVEQAVEAASADPENRKLVARITDRLPTGAQVDKLTAWAAFVTVSIEMLKVAPELNPNDIGVLTMILMVVLYLLHPRSGS
jgi:hypothetical protein